MTPLKTMNLFSYWTPIKQVALQIDLFKKVGYIYQLQIFSFIFITGNTVRMPVSLQGKGKKSKTKKTTELEPLAEFLLHTCKYMLYTKQNGVVLKSLVQSFVHLMFVF